MIGVSAMDGTVTLTGFVTTYTATLAAERAARRVYGVQAIANELVVKRGVQGRVADRWPRRGTGD